MAGTPAITARGWHPNLHSSSYREPQADASASEWVAQERRDPARRPPSLAAAYAFPAEDVVAIQRCVEEHGFAIAQGVLSPDEVMLMREEVTGLLDPAGDAPSGVTRTLYCFLEHSPGAASLLLQHPRLMPIHRAIVGTDEGSGLTLHRTVANLKTEGEGPIHWHRDVKVEYEPGPLVSSGQVLNGGTQPNGMYIYLNGCRPSNGGICVLPGSNRPDWEPPAGLQFIDAFGKQGLEFSEGGSSGGGGGGGGGSGGANPWFDVPGMLPVYSDPGDLVIFGSLCFHAVLPYPVATHPTLPPPPPRLLLGMRFRPSPELPHGQPAPWPLPDLARDFVESQPAAVQPLLAGYTSLKINWSPATRARPSSQSGRGTVTATAITTPILISTATCSAMLACSDSLLMVSTSAPHACSRPSFTPS